MGPHRGMEFKRFKFAAKSKFSRRRHRVSNTVASRTPHSRASCTPASAGEASKKEQVKLKECKVVLHVINVAPATSSRSASSSQLQNNTDVAHSSDKSRDQPANNRQTELRSQSEHSVVSATDTRRARGGGNNRRWTGNVATWGATTTPNAGGRPCPVRNPCQRRQPLLPAVSPLEMAQLRAVAYTMGPRVRSSIPGPIEVVTRPAGVRGGGRRYVTPSATATSAQQRGYIMNLMECGTQPQDPAASGDRSPALPARSQASLPPGISANPTPDPARAAGYGYPTMMPDQSRATGGLAGGYNPYMADYAPKPPPMSSVPPPASKLPTHPDVQFKLLPFFDVLGELLKPSSLAPSGLSAKGFSDSSFSFHLTPQQADEVASNHDGRPGTKLEFPVQIQMRFCLLETSCPQEDHFPPNISVRVNNKTCQLPNPIMSTKAGVEPRRPPKPVNITPLCRISPVQSNSLHVTWGAELGRAYCITVNLVRRLSSGDLLHRLRTRGAKNADFTRALIKEKLNEGLEDEIATTSLKCSLQCPLGKCRMQLPCRATTCKHLQCFDASLYIQMNERKPTWVCPVCDKIALYRTLVIDGYFTEVLKKTSGSCMEVTLHQDGSWRELSKEVQEKPKEDTDVKVQTLDDDSGSDDIKVTEEKAASPEKKDKPAREPDCVDLTLSDSDDDDAAQPPSKRRQTGANNSNNKWQATPVGDTKIKLSMSKPSASVAEATSTTTSGQNNSNNTGGGGSLSALRSLSVEAGAPAPPFYQPRTAPAAAAASIPPYNPSPWTQAYMQGLAPLAPWPSAGAPAGAAPGPVPSGARPDSPDIISLD